MTTILESIKWAKPILSLISQCEKLDTNTPAIVHLRHTERPQATFEQIKTPTGEGNPLLSTDQGKQASYELGTLLPTNRQYRIYHTPSPRTIETADQIHQGLTSNNVNSTIIGPFFTKGPNDNYGKWEEYSARDGADTPEGMRRVFLNRISGQYPPWELEDSQVITMRIAADMVERLSSAPIDGVELYVSHEVHIAAFLFY